MTTTRLTQEEAIQLFIDRGYKANAAANNTAIYADDPEANKGTV